MNVNITELRQGERIRVTSRGQVVAELAPPTASADEAALARKQLRGSVVRYDDPLEPAISSGEWTANQ
jgi:antitoxin (DNA-binding transcriptional repressor) of toxin-antitoxin stability system